jgi:hypothetical protein
MKFKSQKIIFLSSLLIATVSGYYLFLKEHQRDEYTNEGCTIGVVSAKVTSDGRPLLWKIRDNSELPNNEVVFDTTCPYNFIAVVNNGDTSVWMGVNEKGLAIVNSTAKDLPATNHGYSNGTLMRTVLGYCSTVREFEELLIETNETGRRTRANFGLIDSIGEAVIFETSGRDYWKFDANNSRQTPHGYILRTNFSKTGGGTTGIERFRRTESLIKDLHQNNVLSYEGIIKSHLRDFSDLQSNQIAIPYMDRWEDGKQFGYVQSNYSACRYISISASIFRGAFPSEPAYLTTMWATLGQTAGTIALPFWPVGETPSLARGEIIAPLHQVAKDIKLYLFDDLINKSYLDTYKLRDDLGNGIWNMLINLEDSIITSVGAKINNNAGTKFKSRELFSFQDEIFTLVYSKLKETKNVLSSLSKLIVSNDKPFYSYDDNNFIDGCVVHLIDAGSNGVNDLPINDPLSPDFGMPGGDDKIIGNFHFLGENVDLPNMIYFPVMLWKNVPDLPYAGDKIYMRIFNSDNLVSARMYGDAHIYEIQADSIQNYSPKILTINKLLQDNSGKLASTSQQELNYHLYRNYPNPFNPTTKIKFTIPQEVKGETKKVTLKVFDVLGKEIATLVNEEKSAGEYEVEFNGSNSSSGIYFYRIRSGSFIETRRMILLK